MADSLHLTPEYQRGQIAALFVIMGTAGCMSSARRFSDELSNLRTVAKRDRAESPNTPYWEGYLNAIELVSKELLHNEPEAVVKSSK